MDEQEKQKMRIILQSYPGSNPEIVESQLNNLIEREEQKKQLIIDRGFSNALAEVYLDKQGWMRPPGWHTVFFYPDSMRIRNKYLILLIVSILVFLSLFYI